MPLTKPERQAAIDRARRYPEGKGDVWFSDDKVVLQPSDAFKRIVNDPNALKFG